MRAVPMDRLEPRRLFASVTLITHGYENGSDRPSWIDEMKDEIVALDGPATSVYDLRVVRGGGGIKVASFTHFGGAGFTDADGNGDAIVMLDWSDASGVFSYTKTGDVASLVEPYLVNAYPDLGIASPLASVPVHLIGHSRGGSLVSALAFDLGRDGVEVDQLTTLDPRPVFSDQSPRTWTNVRFTDNDWQKGNGGFFTIGGQHYDGAHNLNLDDKVLDNEAYHTALDGGNHVNARLWYMGTIDTAASANDGVHTIPTDWYAGSMGPRGQVGFAYSDLAAKLGRGAPRPADGVGAPFGGSATRAAVTRSSADQWANIGGLHLTTGTTSASAGDVLAAQFDLWDVDSTSNTVTLYLDNNTDPFDAGTTDNPVTPANGYVTSAADAHPQADVPLYTGWVAAGTYHLMARISDGEHVRYTYATDTLVLMANAGNPTPLPDPVSGLATVANAGPDYTVAFTAATPAALLPGAKAFNQRITIRNGGNLPGRGQVSVNVYASADDTLGEGDILLASRTVKVNLTSGKGLATSVPLIAPTTIIAGVYHLIAYLVPTGLGEINAANNATATPTAISIAPPRLDLAGAFAVTPVISVSGKPTGLVVLTNDGNVTAAGRVTVSLFQSAGTPALGSVIKLVSIGVGKSVTIRVPLSSAPVGTALGTLSYAGSLPDVNALNDVFSIS